MHRQVVVFTHDIAFLFLLDEACEDIDPKPPMMVKSISRGLDNTGFCNADPPMRARPLAQVIDGMQSRLNNEKITTTVGIKRNGKPPCVRCRSNCGHHGSALSKMP